jgi:hypothetical protein
MQFLKKPTITETTRLYRLRWFGRVKGMEEKKIPKEYCIQIWKQQDREVDQEIDGKIK